MFSIGDYHSLLFKNTTDTIHTHLNDEFEKHIISSSIKVKKCLSISIPSHTKAQNATRNKGSTNLVRVNSKCHDYI